MNVVLNTAEMQALYRQDPNSKRDGGWQSLMVGLQQRCNRTTGHLTLTAQDLERIPRYAFDYGNGGWEDRLTAAFGRHLGQRLGRP